MMKVPNRMPLFIWAMLGGSILSWIELATNPEGANRYTFLGILSASIIGLVAHFIFDNGHTTKRSAFTTGVAAPNLIGGMVNAGSNIAVSFSLGFFAVYANDSIPLMKPDTAGIEIVVEGTDRDAEVKNTETGEVYIIDSNSPQKIPYAQKLEVKIDGIGVKDIEAGEDYEVDSTNGSKLKIIAVKKQRTSGFLKGFIPFQKNASIQNKIEVVEVEPEVIKEQSPDQGIEEEAVQAEEAPAAEEPDE